MLVEWIFCVKKNSEQNPSISLTTPANLHNHPLTVSSSLKLIPFINSQNNTKFNQRNVWIKGSFTNYVMHFSLFFDHLPTYGYVLASILLIIYLIKICDSYILLTTYPPRRHNVICERPPSWLKSVVVFYFFDR